MDTNTQTKKPRDPLAERVIRNLGGQSAVARICAISQSSVHGWLTHGIPQAREQYLRLLRPEAFRKDA